MPKIRVGRCSPVLGSSPDCRPYVILHAAFDPWLSSNSWQLLAPKVLKILESALWHENVLVGKIVSIVAEILFVISLKGSLHQLDCYAEVLLVSGGPIGKHVRYDR